MCEWHEAEFIAQSRTDLPRLSAALREMMGEKEELAQLLMQRADRSGELLMEIQSLRARIVELEAEREK